MDEAIFELAYQLIPTKWSEMTDHDKFVIEEYICERTRFYYKDNLKHDDIGKIPYNTFTYFFSTCEAMPWANNRLRFSYRLGVGGEEMVGL